MTRKTSSCGKGTQTTMKQEKIIAGADILATQMNHWTFFSIVTAMAILFGQKPPLALWGACSLLPVLFFFIRRYTNRFLIMAGSHLLCLVLLFALPVPGLAVKIPLCLYGVGLTVYSFSLRLRTKERLDEAIAPAVAVGIIALSLFLLHYEEPSEVDFYYIIIAAFYFICYYIKCYFDNYCYFMTVNTGSTGYIPRREIFSTGTRLSLLFILSGMAAILLLSNLDWLAWFFRTIKQGLLWLREHGFFAFLASLFYQEPEQPPEQMPDVGPASPSGMALEMGEPGLFWQILERIMEILVPLALFLLLLFFLFRFFQMVRERFRQKKIFTKEDVFDGSRDIREKYEIKKEKKTQKNFFAFLSPTEKIRRIYKQRIGAKRKDTVKKIPTQSFDSYTARECGSLFQEETLSLLYEKARYSNMACSREDVKSALRKGG